MGIVTLTTDLGYRDPYLALVKARLIGSGLPLQILDLSCEISNNNISDAAFILKNSISSFPAGTIHLVAVKFIMNRSDLNKSNHPDNSRYLLTKYREQFLLSPDTGLFTLIDEAFSEPVYQLYYEGDQKNHFYLKDVLAGAALHLLGDGDISDIASPVTDYYRAFQFKSFVNGNVLRGKGIYVDDFGNIITNITRDQFETVVGKRPFTITLPGTRINTLHTTYEDVRFGSVVVLFNSFGHLEVAVNGKSAHAMLCPRDIGSTFDFNLLIEFHD